MTIPIETVADTFLLLRSFTYSEAAVPNELYCVRCHIEHTSLSGDLEHIVMGKDGESDQSLLAHFLNC